MRPLHVVSALVFASARISLPDPAPAGAALDPVTNTWRMEEPVAAPAGAEDSNAGTRAAWGFGPNVPVHPPDGAQHLWPDLVSFPDGRLYAAWMDDRTNVYKIYGALSTDGGSSWAADQRIDDAPASAMARFVSLTSLPAGDLIAVWEDVRAGAWNWNVYLSRGVWNAGSGAFDWSTSVRVNTTGGPNDAGYYMHPSVASDRFGRVHVAWTDWREGVYYQVYFRSSTDGGLTWGGEVRISDEIGYQPVAGDPALIADPHDLADPPALLCAWNDWRGYAPGGRYPEVFFARSTDGGDTWTNPNVKVNDITSYYQQVAKRVVAATLSGTIAVGWFNDDAVGQSEMRVSRSSNGGATWSSSTSLTDPLIGGSVPVNLAGGLANDLLASWMGYGSDWNVYFRASADAGATWGAIVRADDDATGGAAYNSIIAAQPDGNPIVALQDTRPGYGAYNIWVAPGIRDAAGVLEAPAPARKKLFMAPNPAAGGARISWAGAPRGAIRLRIVDPAGRGVAERMLRDSGPFFWDGRDADGRPVASGIYRVILDSGEWRETGALTVLR